VSIEFLDTTGKIMSKPWKRVGIAAGAAQAMLVALTPTFAQDANKVEVLYGVFLDPTNPNDPRAVAQNKMIEEFERRNPNISNSPGDSGAIFHVEQLHLTAARSRPRGIHSFTAVT
jgi:hypothetical protein